MASEGPRDVEDSIGFFEGLQLKFSDWMSGKDIHDRLDEALQAVDFPMIQWCVQNGADLNKPNAAKVYGHSPFYFALFGYQYCSNSEYVKKLINLGVDVRAIHNYSYPRKTLLHSAIENNRSHKHFPNTLIDVLVEHGVDVDAMECGYTALWLAAFKGKVFDVEKLINAGADINKIALYHPHYPGGYLYPLDIAKLRGHHEVVALLQKHGAKESFAASVASSSSSSRAITPSASIAANRKKAPAKHARKEAPVKEKASKRVRKR